MYSRELDLCKEIIIELRVARRTSVKDLIPKGQIPIILGGQLIPEKVALHVGSFGIAWGSRQNGLRDGLSAKDRDTLVRRAFGEFISSLAYDDSVDTAASKLHAAVVNRLSEDILAFKESRTFAFGCWLVHDQVLELELGPVRFVPREQWLSELSQQQLVDAVTERRVRRAWEGHRPPKRKSGFQQVWEEAVLETVGDCHQVCCVDIANMASGVAEQKSLLVARLALTTVALLWEKPSKAMEGFGLIVDGGRRKANVLTYTQEGIKSWGWRSRRMPGSTWADDNLTDIWEKADWLREPCAKALTAFATAQLAPERDTIDRVITLSLWWLNEAITAETSLMATVKFGAVLDALSGGNGNAGQIEAMLALRLGIPRSGPVTTRGKTLRQIVKEIYGVGRSSTLHGLNDQFGSDWSEIAALAERLSRDALAATVAWSFETGSDSLPDFFKELSNRSGSFERSTSE